MGKRREAVRVLLSLFCVAAVAFLAFAWWGHVKSNDDEIPYCTDVYPVGRLIVPAPSDNRKGCLNEAGEVSFPVSKPYECDNGSVLLANDYGWWKSDDEIVKALTDRGTPPRAALDDCLGR